MQNHPTNTSIANTTQTHPQTPGKTQEQQSIPTNLQKQNPNTVNQNTSNNYPVESRNATRSQPEQPKQIVNQITRETQKIKANGYHKNKILEPSQQQTTNNSQNNLYLYTASKIILTSTVNAPIYNIMNQNPLSPYNQSNT